MLLFPKALISNFDTLFHDFHIKIMMKQSYFILTGLLLLLFSSGLTAQEEETIDSTQLVQFSGLVLDGTGDELEPIPFVTVSIEGESRGVYTDWKGFFSLVVEKGEEVIFSAVGYKTANFVVPDTLTDNRYSLVQLLTADTINLPETVVFPWPSRDHFKLEFLAMDVGDDMVGNAEENLAKKALASMVNKVGMDGNENSDYYLRQQAKSYYSYGQTAPMNVFNPLAWRDFFKAWKDGAFKRKKDK